MAAERARGFTLIELMIVVAIIGLLAAIAVPNFMKMQGRAKQSEAQANLKALFHAEKSHYQAKDCYSDNVLDVGFSPERGNRYQYFLGPLTGPFDDRSGTVPTTGLTATGISIDSFRFRPITPQTFACGSTTGAMTTEFVAGAQGQLDDDAALDQWTISSATRQITAACDAAGNVPSGTPANEQSDLEH